MAALRKRARAAWAALRGNEPKATAYTGASSSRLTQDWIFSATRSVDQEIRGDLRALKNRARDLARNNPHASRFRRLLSHNVVGPHGIRLQSKVKDQAGKPDRDSSRKIETAFRRWSRKGSCTADGLLSFDQVQRLHTETLAVDGEALVRILPGFDNEFGFAVQVLDTDQLDADFNRPAGSGKNEVRMGVERDGWGRPVAYHLWDGHPTDYDSKRKRVRIPAEQIVHDFTAGRAGQTRGITPFAPILMRAKMLDGYEEATVVGARVGASNMGFFMPDENHVSPEPGEPDDDDIPFEAEPATFKRIPLGYKFEKWDPSQPATSFSEFDKAMLRSIAAGFDVGYCSLTGDLSDVNYSSIRQGKLDERDVFRVLQGALTGNLMERVFEQWLKWALTTGALELPSLNASHWADHEWQPRGWDWVDPLKDIQAAERAVGLRVTSRTRICAERGIDFEEVLSELAEEQRMADDLGVKLAPPQPKGRSAPIVDDDEEEEEEEEGRTQALTWIDQIEGRMNGNGNHAHATSRKE